MVAHAVARWPSHALDQTVAPPDDAGVVAWVAGLREPRRRAVLAFLGSWDRKTRCDPLANGCVYVELCAEYLAGADRPLPSSNATRRAFDDLAGRLGLRRTSRLAAVRAGAVVRRLQRGQRGGDHWLVAPEQVRCVRSAASELRTRGLLPLDIAAEAESFPFEIRFAGGASAYSPFSTDRVPSASVTINPDGVSGYLTSHREADRLPDGRPAVAYMRRTATGAWRGRPSLRTAAHLTRHPGDASSERYDPVHKYWGSPRVDALNRAPVGEVAARGTASTSTNTENLLLVGVGEPDSRRRRPVVGTLTALALRTRTLSTGDALSLVARDERRGGVADEERAAVLGWTVRCERDLVIERQARELVPDRLVSLFTARPVDWLLVRRVDGRDAYRPVRFVPACVTHVLIDLDGFADAPDRDAARRAAAAACEQLQGDPLLTGRGLVLATSPTGLHVVAELRTPRWRPYDWARSGAATVWREELAARVLDALRAHGYRGGHVDAGPLHSARPLTRRPGWRLLADGRPFRVHVLAWGTPDHATMPEDTQ